MSTCATHCGRPTRDTLALCDGCRAQLEKALSEVPALVTELTTTLTRQSRFGGQSGGSRSAQKPLPFDVRASQVLDQLSIVLHGWTRVIVEDHHQDPPPDTLRGMSRFLLWRLDMLSQHEAAGDIYEEITSACAHGWRAVDRAPDRIPLGPCGASVGDGPGTCAEPLYGRPGVAAAQCRACGKVHAASDRWERMQAELDAMLMTSGEIARLGQSYYRLPRDRTRKLLDSWLLRGTLAPHGVNRDGRPLVPFGEAVRRVLATPMRQRRAS